MADRVEFSRRREFLKRQTQSARMRAIHAYCERCFRRLELGGLPDYQTSAVELVDGKPHAIVRTAEGTMLATYRIRKDGRLRYLKPQETTS